MEGIGGGHTLSTDGAGYTSLPVGEATGCDLGISPAKGGEEYGRKLLMVGQGQSVD